MFVVVTPLYQRLFFESILFLFFVALILYIYHAELLAKLTFVRHREAKQLVKLSTACEGSRGREATLVALRRERNTLN